MTDEACVFEVEEGTYSLAPVGFPNDPPSFVNISRKRKRYSVVPPTLCGTKPQSVNVDCYFLPGIFAEFYGRYPACALIPSVNRRNPFAP